MSVTGTQLQSVNGSTKTDIYPISDASVINATKGTETTNVQSWLTELTTDISNLTENAIKLNITIEYANTTYSTVSQVTEDENLAWGETFVQPTAELPYTWKKTTIKASSSESSTSASSVSYELASISSESTQTLYAARSADTKSVKITYNQIDKNGALVSYYNDTLDNILAISDNNFWSKTPVSISATNPNGYVATRTRGDNGEWQAFEIVQNAKWAYNSIPTFKYQVTSTTTVPSVTENSSDYSKVDGWSDTITSSFTGYLWMINATIVNDVYQLNGTKVWSSPTLISIVK